jgi:asparagine synthase (glutamine-hydrolysing)
MTANLRHRGPDGEGFFDDGDLALGHRRLAILDISDAGRQPMTSRDGRWTIVLNGEIFNYVEMGIELNRKLREDAGDGFRRFRSSTDTEVLLEACSTWGVEKTLDRANGMFAFALWDARERELTLARDRVGEKPLVYFRRGSTFAFASELKALFPLSDRRLDPAAVDAYLALGYVPAPLSIFRDCRKLAAGHLLRYRGGEISIRRWWFPEKAASTGSPMLGSLSNRASSTGRVNDPPQASPKATRGGVLSPKLTHGAASLPHIDKTLRLRELMRDSVRLRLRSDVPVALYLSGGVDSSVVAAECVRLGSRPEAFTVAFEGRGRDPRARAPDAGNTDVFHARFVAKTLELEHHVLEISERAITGEIEGILDHYDEPFADSSALPSFALAHALGRYKVVLTGDGGDEAFGGYRHYERIHAKQAVKALAAAVGFCDGWEHTPGAAAGGSSEDASSEAGNRALQIYVQSKALFRASERARLMNGNRRGDDLDHPSDHPPSHQPPSHQPPSRQPPSNQTRDGPPRDRRSSPLSTLLAADEFLANAHGGALKRALWSDRHLYLPNDLTYKMDIALAAHGMEGRAPFLDHRVLEWAQNLEAQDLVRGGKKKILLRAAYRGVLPDEILDRPKLGFGAPIGEWLRGPLREFARDVMPCRLLAGPVGGQGLSGQRWWSLVVFSQWARRVKATW